jgi:hypothetical protein
MKNNALSDPDETPPDELAGDLSPPEQGRVCSTWPVLQADRACPLHRHGDLGGFIPSIIILQFHSFS